MTSKAIEELATNAVKKSIITNDFLDQFISENDKEPTWDGYVYIYDDKKKKKSDLRGRVAVQIKGKQTDEMPTDEISFPVSTVDMKNFFHDGGAIYFVVYISSDGTKETIYYTTLTPVKLKIYLFQAKGKNTKSLKLTQFPTDNNRKSTIFLNLYLDCKKQVSFATKEMHSLEELVKQDVLTGLTISVTGYGYSQNDMHKALFENEVYLYANIKGSNVPIPIDLIPRSLQTQETESCTIAVNDKLYYSYCSRIRSKGKVIIQIGKSFKIIITELGALANINYNSAPMLSDRIKDTEFMLDVLHSKHFSLNGYKLDINPTVTELKKFNPEVQTETVEYYKKMQMVLKLLNVQQDINLSTITEKEQREIHNLITAFVDKKTVRNIRKDLPDVTKLKIQNIVLILVFEEVSEDSGEYNIQNFFGSNVVLAYDRLGSDDKYITSQYSILQKDDYLQISNIDYDAILPSYQALLINNPTIFDRANMDMLNMISAYDESKNTSLLKVAKCFAEWILNEDKDVLPYEIKLLNLLQIVRRERELNIDEVKQLCAITENSLTREDIKVGAYLLLDNQMAAQIHFDILDEDMQEAFKKYPIFAYWKER
jgi:hypothetical protein